MRFKWAIHFKLLAQYLAHANAIKQSCTEAGCPGLWQTLSSQFCVQWCQAHQSLSQLLNTYQHIIHIYMHTYAHRGMYLCIHTYMLFIYTYMHTSMYIHVCVIYAHRHIHTYVYISLCICVYTCVYIHIYSVYVYIHIHTHTWGLSRSYPAM